MKYKVKKKIEKEVVRDIKLDLGCGKNKKEGFIGVDCISFLGVDVVTDLGKKKWPWEDDSVSEVYCSHFIEHLDTYERVFFVNELYRVLKVGAKAQIITPHWASCRAYGDLTHKWPPVSEFWFYYLSKEWRSVNAPHNDELYNKCDFEVTWGYSLASELNVRNEEYKMYAMKNYKEVITDIIAMFTKR